MATIQNLVALGYTVERTGPDDDPIYSIVGVRGTVRMTLRASDTDVIESLADRDLHEERLQEALHPEQGPPAAVSTGDIVRVVAALDPNTATISDLIAVARRITAGDSAGDIVADVAEAAGRLTSGA